MAHVGYLWQVLSAIVAVWCVFLVLWWRKRKDIEFFRRQLVWTSPLRWITWTVWVAAISLYILTERDRPLHDLCWAMWAIVSQLHFVILWMHSKATPKQYGQGWWPAKPDPPVTG